MIAQKFKSLFDSERGALLVLLVFIALSILVRAPNLNRPLSKHHEFNAAMVLIPMEQWNADGVAKYSYAPVMTYQHEGDQNINNMTTERMCVNGKYYYLSFPTLTYLAPYATFQLIGVDPSPLALQWFTIALHILTAFLLYRLIKLIVGSRSEPKEQRIAGIAAAAFILFAPTPLWFFSNGYTHHVLAIPFVLLALLFLARLIVDNAHYWRNVFMVTLSVFIVASIVWYGLILAGLLALFGVYSWFKFKKYGAFIWLPLLGAFFATYCMYVQYANLVGAEVFLEYLKNRFFVRSTVDDGASNLLSVFSSTLKWYVVGFSLWIVLPAIFWLGWLKKIKLSSLEKVILGVSFGTAMLHHLLLGEFTVAHNYSVLIDSIYLAVFIGIGASMAFRSAKYIRPLQVSMVAVCLVGIGQFYYINRPGEISQNGDRYDQFKVMGETIRTSAKANEVIYLVNFHENPAPQLMYYAKRNFIYAKNVVEAEQSIEERHDRNARIFVVEKDMIVRIIVKSKEAR